MKNAVVLIPILQFGFKKATGCPHAILVTARSVVSHCTLGGSTVNLVALYLRSINEAEKTFVGSSLRQLLVIRPLQVQ